MTTLHIGDLVMCRDNDDYEWSGPFVLVDYDAKDQYPFKTAHEAFKQCRLARDKDLPNRGKPVQLMALRHGDFVMCRDTSKHDWRGPYMLLWYENNRYIVFNVEKQTLYFFEQCRKATSYEAAELQHPIAPETTGKDEQ